MSSLKIEKYFGYVPIDKIEPIYLENVSKKQLNKNLKKLESGDYFRIPIKVVYDSINAKYYLIGGYPEYVAYKDWGVKEVLCEIKPFTDDITKRIELLKRMFDYQNNPWIDKHSVIQQLIDDGKSIKEIAEKGGLNKSDVKRYLIHPDIPTDIVGKGKKNKASFPNIDVIRRLDLPYKYIRILYNKAVKKQKDDDRLTGDRLQKIKWLFRLNRFEDLEPNQKWIMIESALSYKQSLLNLWQKEIDSFFNNN